MSDRNTFDPGWNDPPKLAYVANTNKPRTLLNKRVPFPINGHSPAAASQPLQPYENHKCLPQAVESEETEYLPHELNPEESKTILEEVLEVLYSLLDDSEELGSKVAEIKKKIKVMEISWSSNQLSLQIQWKMKLLAKALKEDNPTRADNIHKELMVDHLSSVSSWMVGIRHLINHCIVKKDLLSIDNSED